MDNRTFGYARVSSREQHEDRQIEALTNYGVSKDNIIVDKCSGKDTEREGYQYLKKQILRSGDTLVIKELDRLSRSKSDIKQELEFFNSFVDKGLLERLHNVVDNDFGRITYTDAVKLLQESGHKFDYPVSWGIDLQTEHERYLTEQVFNKPVFVTDYPKDIKAFYMRMNDDGKTVAAADCLVPGIGEIIGGSQREERLDLLTKRMQELGLREEDYWWYLDLRRYGSCRHAGFGLGFERMVMYLTGVSNIRDVELHPRTVGNADF